MASVKPILESTLTRYPRGNFAIALACLFLIGIVWWVTLDRARFERTETIANAVKQNENLAIAYEEQTIRTLKGVDQAVSFVKYEYDEQGLKLDIRRMIETSTVDASLFTYIGITEEHGNVLLGSHDFQRTNFVDREAFVVHKKSSNDEMFIGKPTLGRITHKWAIPMSRRINKPDGSFGGIVYASVDPDYFTSFYLKTDLGEQGVVTLIGLDGIVRARRVGAKGSFGEDMRGARLFLEQARTKVGSFLGEARLDGVPRFLSFRTLAHFPLIVVVGTSESETMARFHTREHGYYLNALVASAIILTFAAFMIVVWSRQKRAVDSLIESEARYRATFGQGVVGVAHTTLDGRFIEANAKVSEILGYTSAELSMMNAGDVIAPEDLDQARSDRARLVTGELADLVAETGYVRKDGSVGWISRGMSLVRDASGSPKYCISLFFDITERKQAQQALAESEARFRGLAEQSLTGIIIHNQQRYLYVNPGFAKMSGYTQDEVMKQHPIDLVAEQDRAQVRELLGKRMSGEIRQLRHTLQGVRKDGTVIEVETHGSRMMVAGSPELIVIVLDITERKRNEEALRSYATRLRELSHRLRTVEETERHAISRELHDRIGQELSTLGLILGSLGAKLPRESLPEVHKQLQDMQGLLKSMAANVRDVMAELRPPVLDDYGLLAALRQLVTEFAKRSGIAAELSGVELQPRPSLIVETAMYRISQEALNNIAKHARAKNVEISLYAAPDRVVLDITDDGIGFDANETLPDKQHWGLITMHERAEAVGIAFRLESAPGTGTRIVLEAERAAT